MKIAIDYRPSEYKVVVLSDNLWIKYTKDYIKSLTGLGDYNARKTLYWLGQTYDEYKGISIEVIQNTSEGIKSGLL